MAGDQNQAWICTACGYIHEGGAPPERCPACAVPADCFEPYEEPGDGDDIILDDEVLGGPAAAIAGEPLDTLQRVTSGLARDIGTRRAGSPNERRAADLLEGEFGQVCPEVVRHEYRILGWDPGREGTLVLDGAELPTRLGIGCPPTPEEGISGLLEPLGGALFGLRRPGEASAAAHLMAYRGPGRQAIPLLWRPLGSIPAGIVGADDEARLAAAAQRRAAVTFTCRPQLEPGAVSWNVEGVLPGDPGRHVIVVAHCDTVYASPGANDNAASCACLPALAARLATSPRGQRPTLRFLATGAEEIDLQGARCYVQDLLRRDAGDQVVLSVNFDSLTWGDQLQIGACERAGVHLADLGVALDGADLKAYARHWGRARLGAGVDSAAFHAAGLPALNVNTTGDARTTALWHTPDDTVERVPWDRAVDGVEVFAAFLGGLA